MSQEDGVIWRLSAAAPHEAAANAVSRLFEQAAPAVSAFETSPGGAWTVEAWATEPPNLPALRAGMAVIGAGLGDAGFEAGLAAERLAPRDWIAENQASFPPLRAGRFFVHGSHVAPPPASGAIPIRIDAATAFGTGEHATTRGCLLALAALARRRRYRRVLDMGTGTGILAIAATKLWRLPVLARDIDAGSVAVARTNAGVNDVAALLDIRRSDGYADRAIARRAPFDLVLANILARPLAAMAPDLARVLAPGGVAVLSGLLARQEPFVLAAHRPLGLVLERRWRIDGWHTLLLRRGRAGFPPAHRVIVD
jgi:ribosomal protein L11 methyltransferase